MIHRTDNRVDKTLERPNEGGGTMTQMSMPSSRWEQQVIAVTWARQKTEEPSARRRRTNAKDGSNVMSVTMKAEGKGGCKVATGSDKFAHSLDDQGAGTPGA